MTEERIKYTKDSLEKRIEELERKMALLADDHRQLELDV
jgi:prefoldin subunit 5